MGLDGLGGDKIGDTYARTSRLLDRIGPVGRFFVFYQKFYLENVNFWDDLTLLDKTWPYLTRLDVFKWVGSNYLWPKITLYIYPAPQNLASLYPDMVLELELRLLELEGGMSNVTYPHKTQAGDPANFGGVWSSGWCWMYLHMVLKKLLHFD